MVGEAFAKVHMYWAGSASLVTPGQKSNWMR